MKKIVVFAAFVFALFLTQKVMAAGQTDGFGNLMSPLLRSSRTCVAENFVLIATGAIHFHSVIIESPTVNSESFLSIYNSTIGAIGGYNPNTSTAAFVPTNSQLVMPIPPGHEIFFDIPLSSGLVQNKTGIGCTSTLFEFMEPYTETIGAIGRTPTLPFNP